MDEGVKQAQRYAAPPGAHNKSTSGFEQTTATSDHHLSNAHLAARVPRLDVVQSCSLLVLQTHSRLYASSRHPLLHNTPNSSRIRVRRSVGGHYLVATSRGCVVYRELICLSFLTIMRQAHAYHSHLNANKGSGQKHRLAKTAYSHGKQTVTLKKLLPYGSP